MDDVQIDPPAMTGPWTWEPIDAPADIGDVEPVGDVGDMDDLDAVYRRTYGLLVRIAYLLVDTREQAEEVVQDAFAAAYPRWHRLRQPEAYLRTSVINGCRRVHRHRRVVAIWRDDPRLADGPTGVNGSTGAEDPLDHVADLVRRLPSPQREAIVLRYYLQATDAEIADLLGIALGTVKSTLHRARARLREELT